MNIFNEIDEITNLSKSLADALMLANAQNDSAYNNVTLAHIILEKLEKVQKKCTNN